MLQYAFGQPVRGDAHAHHAARHRQRFVHGHAVAQFNQVVSRGQSGRACPDDGNPFRPRAGRGLHWLPSVGQGVVYHEPFERHDTHGLVHKGAGTGSFARVMAGAAAHAWERVVFLYSPQCFAMAPLSDEGDVSLGALPGRAAIPAGGGPQFLDGVSGRHCLGVQAVRSLTRLQPFFEQVGQ